MVNVLVLKGANSIWEHALHDSSINLRSKPKKPNPKDKMKWEVIITCTSVCGSSYKYNTCTSNELLLHCVTHIREKEVVVLLNTFCNTNENHLVGMYWRCDVSTTVHALLVRLVYVYWVSFFTALTSMTLSLPNTRTFPMFPDLLVIKMIMTPGTILTR